MKTLLSNNERRMHGLPPRRKSDKRKRFYTRCEALETIDAFLDWCNGRYDNQEVTKCKKE